MKNLFLSLMVLAGVAELAAPAAAQDRPRPVETRPVTVACCRCLGAVDSLDISTGQGGGPTDPYWKVNGGNAYITAPVQGAWMSLAGASWIQPVASSTAGSVAPGDYEYTLDITIPKCTIPMKVRLVGVFAADNSAEVFWGPPPALASCAGPNCFGTSSGQTVAPVQLNQLLTGAGPLRIRVRNQSGPSGLLVRAKLLIECQRE